MKNIAYKTISGNPNLPNGFITEHFETDQDVLEGYTVVNKAAFDQLLINNVMMMRMHEENKVNVTAAHPNLPPVPRRPDSHAEPTDHATITQIKKEIEDRKKAAQQDQADEALFKQFLEWKRSQGSGS